MRIINPTMAHLSADYDIIHQNHTSSPTFQYTDDPTNDPLFHLCWRRQSCQYCLQGDVACSWCPISSTCIPNPSTFPLLTPLNSSHICPLGSKERWELRATPLGCDVSTITFLTGVGAVMSTLVAVGLLSGIVWTAKRVSRLSREGKLIRDARWRRRVMAVFARGDDDRDPGDLNEDLDHGERRPLLG